MENQIAALLDRRSEGGFNARELLRNDAEWVACMTCRLKHRLAPSSPDQDYDDFAEKHKPERGCIVFRLGPEYLERRARAAERRKKALRLAVRDFLHNSNVKESFQAEQTLDLTAYGIASSVTAGWCSAWIDNSANLYLDILFTYLSAAVNTGASSQKAHYLYSAGSWASGELPSNTAGNTVTNSASTSATLTYLDITANPVGFPLIKVVPYITTNKVLSGGGLIGTAKAHDGWCPPFSWLGVVNAAGPTSTATGSKVGYAGAFATVI